MDVYSYNEKQVINYSNYYVKYLDNLPRIKEAKEHFLKTGEILDFVRPEVAASWKRCIQYGLDPNVFKKNA